MVFKEFEIDDVDELIAPAMSPIMQQAGLMGEGQGAQLPGAPGQIMGPEDMASMLGTMTQGAPSA